ncbi:MAG: TonB-dependent receptor [Sphingobacteriaceae bacterium]|nr:TonB-dependent receptor [Sphingobacteriaceae bacterium]
MKLQNKSITRSHLKVGVSTLIILLLTFRVSYSQQQPLNMDVDFKSVKIDEFVQELEKKSGYHFYYNQSHFDSLRITINLKGSTIREILNEAFKNSKYQYAIDSESNIFLTLNTKIDERLPLSLFGNFSDVSKVASKSNSVSITTLDNERVIPKQIDTKAEEKVYEVGLRTPSILPGKATISGYLREGKSGEPVVGASIFIMKPRLGVVTNENGYYSLQLPKGQQTLMVRVAGQREISRQIILYSDGTFNIDLKSQVISLKEVVVTRKSDNLAATQMGVNKINIQSIKNVPTVFGEADILKVVLTLPGVKSVGEASGGFNVRGGATDQNLILFNDATIYNPSHFFGFFSAFNPDLVKDVELYKSSIPAKYGGRLSSVLNISGREGNKKKFTGTAGIGLLTSRLNIEGPLNKDKTSFLLGGRTTYSDLIFGLMPKKSVYRNSKASFYDVNLLINHKFNEKNSVSLMGYVSDDQSDLGTDTSYSYANQNASIKWQHVFNKKLNGNFVIGYDGYKYNTESNSEYDTLGAYNLGFDINQVNFKSGLTYYLNPKHTVDFGLNSIYYKLHPGSYLPKGRSSLVTPDVLEGEQALENALYISDNYEMSPSLSFTFGVRYSHFSNLGPKTINSYAPGLPKEENNILDSTAYRNGQVSKTYQGPEIRFSARYVVNKSLSIKAGYNSLRQYIHLLSNTTAISPTDTWKLSDPNIRPQQGNQISLGLYKNFDSNALETSVEVYFKRIKNYLDYKSGAQLIMNHTIETDVINTQGKAYGAEFFIKKTAGKLNGWASYTYSRTFLKMDDPNAGELINGGEYYPANFDKPHDFTVIGNYKLSHRLSFSSNITYSTGRPITVPIGLFTYSGSLRALYGDRNSYRVPDYFRTDLSLNIDGNHKVNQVAHNSWTVGVYNLTGRKNPYSTFFTSQGGVVKGYKLSIFGTAIPFVNYNLRF